MGRSNQGKGNKAGNPKSGKGVGNGMQAAVGRGAAISGEGGMLSVAKVERLLANFGRNFAAKLSKLGGSVKSDLKKEVLTGLHCKAEKCYAFRTTCF